MLRATWYEGTAQLLSLIELKSHLLELYFIGWTINRRRRGGNRSTRRKPLATSFRKYHILKLENSNPKQARKADLLTVTPRVAPHCETGVIIVLDGWMPAHPPSPQKNNNNNNNNNKNNQQQQKTKRKKSSIHHPRRRNVTTSMVELKKNQQQKTTTTTTKW